MKRGDLVRFKLDLTSDNEVTPVGLILRVDVGYWGGGAGGAGDRVLVSWPRKYVWKYCEATEVEVISESR